MDYINDLFKAITPITHDLRKRVLEKCKELGFDTNVGIVSLDESLINLIDIKSILVDAIENKKLVQLPITIQKELTLILNEITKFIEGLNAGTNHVENIVNAIEKINVYIWQFGFHNLSKQVLGYHEKMNQLKIQQTELSKLKDEAEDAIHKKNELESLVKNISEANGNVNTFLNDISAKNKDAAELLKSATGSAQAIGEIQKSISQIENSLKTIAGASAEVESDIKNSEKNITAFSNKIDEYKNSIDSISDKAKLTMEQSTAAYDKDRAAVEKFLGDQGTASTELFKKIEDNYDETISKWNKDHLTVLDGISDKAKLTMEQSTAAYDKDRAAVEKFLGDQGTASTELFKKIEDNYDETISKWTKDYSTVLATIEELLPRALTTGLSAAYYDKKESEIKDYGKHTTNFEYSIKAMVCVSIIPFIFSITRLMQGISLETVIFNIPRVVLAIFPLYIPVLWLAYSANKKMNLSKRLIEEYTHKEVLSKTYEGLAKQISNLKDDSMAKELRVKLLYNVLEVSSENPGKLISDYAKSDHPFEEALDKSVKLASAVHKLSGVPGFAKIVAVLDKKAKETLREEVKKAGDGMEALSGLQNEKD